MKTNKFTRIISILFDRTFIKNKRQGYALEKQIIKLIDAQDNVDAFTENIDAPKRNLSERADQDGILLDTLLDLGVDTESDSGHKEGKRSGI